MGWRGQRVGNHPFCRKCGFDLIGRPAQSYVCSECGAWLPGRRKIVIGVRRRMGSLMLAGAALFIPGMLVMTLMGHDKLRAVDWQAKKPVWWLVRDVKGASLKARDAA